MKVKGILYVIVALCLILPIEIFILDKITDNDRYIRYAREVTNKNWCKGTYAQAIFVFERELADPANTKSFEFNEVLINNLERNTRLYNYRIMIGEVFMLLNKKDYLKYRDYVDKRSKEIKLGVETPVVWEE